VVSTFFDPEGQDKKSTIFCSAYFRIKHKLKKAENAFFEFRAADFVGRDYSRSKIGWTRPKKLKNAGKKKVTSKMDFLDPYGSRS